MITVVGVSKNFGSIQAIKNISFQLSKGEIVALVGPNGAGKTTLMRLICGYLEPSQGDITILNQSLKHHKTSALKNIGYVPENSPLYGDMTVFEYCSFIAQLHHLKKNQFKERYAKLMHKFALENVINQKIETLSKGFRHRVAIAAALLAQPKILILDEPTEGLDPNQKYELREILQEYGKDNLVIISTHIMEEVEALSSRIMLINKGKIVKDSSAEEIKEDTSTNNMEEAFRKLTNL